MPTNDPKLRAFHNHKYRALRSGIVFEFSFDGWKQWWLDRLGPWWMEKRGCRKGQYVMARDGDAGPYAAWNVKCKTCNENNSEVKHAGGEKHCHAKLTAAQVREARKLYVPHSAEFGMRALARKYGVGGAAMGNCLRGDTWQSVDAPVAAISGRNRKLTQRIVVEARRLYIPHHPERGANALARKHGVCAQTMWEVVTFRTWPVHGGR